MGDTPVSTDASSHEVEDPDRGERAAAALRTYSPDEVREVLTRREIKALLLRSGAHGMAEPMTYREVGRMLGVGPERARQLVTQSIRKLARHREEREQIEKRGKRAGELERKAREGEESAAGDKSAAARPDRGDREIPEALLRLERDEELRRAGFLPPLPGQERPAFGRRLPPFES